MPISKYKKPFAKKAFGQNFLVDQTYIQKIIQSLHLTGDDTVVEIGAGRGALTEQLIERAGMVIAIELDRDLTPLLRERFGHFGNFELIESDALELDFSEFAKFDKGSEKLKLVANLPYNISTAILQRLIEQRHLFSEMILMFQREVVERITAPAGNSERGFLTVLVEAYLESEKLFDVPPTAFRPTPKVWSSVVRIVPKDSDITKPALFRKIVSVSFAKKRKTIHNNLKDEFVNAKSLLEKSGIDPNRRAETLLLDEWIALTRATDNLSETVL